MPRGMEGRRCSTILRTSRKNSYRRSGERGASLCFAFPVLLLPAFSLSLTFTSTLTFPLRYLCFLDLLAFDTHTLRSTQLIIIPPPYSHVS